MLILVCVSCGLLLSGLFGLANPGAVLSLLDGPVGCDPALCVVWFQFRMLRRFLAYRPGEVARVYRLLEHVAAGCPGHGPVHLLVDSAAEIGFLWPPEMVGWAREGLPVLSNLASPIQHFRAAILEGWRGKVSADLCARKGFRGGPWLDVDDSLQLLNSDHVRERDKALLKSILVGGVWNGFLLHKVKGQRVPCRFCGGDDGDGHPFWECLFHLWLRFVNILSYMISWSWISLIGRGACFDVVGCLFFLGSMGFSLGWESPGRCL